MEDDDHANLRKSFTVRQKLTIIDNIEARLKAGEKIGSCCTSWGIQTGQYSRWKKLYPTFSTAKLGARCVGNGRKSVLEEESGVGDELLQWMFSLRDQGVPISYRMIDFKAGKLSAAFRSKTKSARYQIVRRFATKHNFAIRAKTHEAQRKPGKVEEEAKF